MTRKIRGGQFHAYLISQAQVMLEDRGFATDVEMPIGMTGGRINFVDLLAKRGNINLAIEVETTESHVVSNARKAAELGLLIWVVVADPHTKKRVTAKLRRHCPEIQSSIRVLLLAQLPQALSQLMEVEFPGECARKQNSETPGIPATPNQTGERPCASDWTESSA